MISESENNEVWADKQIVIIDTVLTCKCDCIEDNSKQLLLCWFLVNTAHSIATQRIHQQSHLLRLNGLLHHTCTSTIPQPQPNSYSLYKVKGDECI